MIVADDPGEKKLMIYVVGCNHGIQVYSGGLWAAGDAPTMQEQRNNFDALLEDIVKQRKIEFIAEESGGGEETIAEVLATKYKIPPARNINSSNADNEQMEIPENYLTGPYTNEHKQN